MNLIRRLSSGSSRSEAGTGESEATVADANARVGMAAPRASAEALESSSNRDDILLEGQEPEDVFEDASSAGVVQSTTGVQQQEERDDEDDDERPAAGGPQFRVRAPVSEETEENEDGGEDDGEASFASEDSFDSALERMAASSVASFDAATSPRITSPVGSMSGRAMLGDSPGDMSVAQQGALMRLNQLIRGESSLDMSVIENSNEEKFRTLIGELAESRNESVENASFASIVDALLPLVTKKSGTPERQAVSELDESVSRFGSSQKGFAFEQEEVHSPMPKVKLTAEDEPYFSEDEEDTDGDEHVVDTDGGESGDSKIDDKSVAENGDEDKAEKEDGIVHVESPDTAKEQSSSEQHVDVEVTGGEELASSPVERTLDRNLEVKPSRSSRDTEPVETDDDSATSRELEDTFDSQDMTNEPKQEVENPDESAKVYAMPTAKLTIDDSDEAVPSDGDSEERDIIGDGREDEDVEEGGGSDHEYQSDEGGGGEDAEDQDLKIRAFPDEEADSAYPYPPNESGFERRESKGLKDDVEGEDIAPKIRAELPEDSNEADTKVGEQGLSALRGEEAEEEAPADYPLADVPEVSGRTKNSDEDSEGVEEHSSSSPLSQRRIDVSADGLEETPANLKDENVTLAPPDLSRTISAEDDELVEENALAKNNLDDGVDRADITSRGLEFQPSEGLDSSPSKSRIGSSNPVTVDSNEREDGDNEGDWDEDIEEEDDEEAEALLESSSALAALVRAADATGGGEADTPSLGAAGPSLPARPTRVGRAAPSSDSATRVVQSRSSVPANSQLTAPDEGQANGDANDGNEETREKLQVIRVKFLRLAFRLNQSVHNVVVAQVLYRLGLAEQLRGGRSSARNGAFSFDRASAIAEEQEAAGPEEIDFTCTIMLLGKTGVGKSATINSIFDEAKTGTNAFMPSTKKVQEIVGHVHGIKVRVIDTPGLLPSVADQRHNEKVMASVKKFIKKSPPDIVLYFDRLDMQSRDYGDLPLLRTITDTFGAAVWFNAIVVLTHASSAPPDGPNGLPLSYEMFVAQRSHVVQQTIRQAAGDMRLMNPVSLVENHAACRVNRTGQKVLPNGQVWKPQLLLLCFASKILAEANSLLKLQDNTPGRPFGARPRVPPLPFLLSSLLQSRAQLKLPDEQIGDEDESEEEDEDESSSDEEEDYDQLPPFRRLSKEEVAELDEGNRRNYFEELAERERLFQKKMWKEELKRRRDLRRRMADSPDGDQTRLVDDGAEDDMGRSAAVPVPMPDMAIPPSFDSDNPSHRYRYLETANQWLVRPVLETHGWDHDSGYDGFSLEKVFAVRDKIPVSVSGQITKDKKEANVTMETAASYKHGEGKVTLAGLDLQTIGKDLAYTLRSETRFSNFKGNKTTGGLALTYLGDTLAAGMKIEDRLIVGKRLKLVLNGGAITGRGDVAYGGSLEATLRDKDYPFSRTLSVLGLSVMDWHGDLAIGGNLQSQMVLGKTMVVGRANLNNRGAGQISIRASSSDQLQMALIGILPIIRSLANRLFFSQSQQ